MTVCKYVIVQSTLSCRRVGIRGDESAKVGVIEAALEVIEFAFRFVGIAAVAEGVDRAEGRCHCAIGGEQLAPRIIGIGNNCRAGTVKNGYYIVL